MRDGPNFCLSKNGTVPLSVTRTRRTKMSDSNTPSRRDFLKGTTAAAAGAALAGGLNVARSAHAAGSDVLKVVLIGCGDRGRGAVSQCLDSCPNIKVIALADAFADAAQYALGVLQKKYADKIDLPPERIFVGFDAYQKAIAANPDLVMIATPPGFRPIHYAAAIQAGKHVFMEKPCCVDAPGFRSVMETNKLAEDKGLRVAVGLQRRHSKEFVGRVKEIQDGALGDIMVMRAYWNQGPIWIRKRQPDQTEMQYQMRNWYHFVWLCGDHIVEQHVHNIDMCNWVKNAHPISANGMGSCHVRNNRGIGQIYDNHFVEFTYDDGSKMYSQCRQQPRTWPCVSQFVHGTKGPKGGLELPGNGGDGYTQEHVDLVNAIRDGAKLHDGWYGDHEQFHRGVGPHGDVLGPGGQVGRSRRQRPQRDAREVRL